MFDSYLLLKKMDLTSVLMKNRLWRREKGSSKRNGYLNINML